MRLATKQPCETVRKWLKDNLGPSCLAPLTGQDSAALSAAVQIVSLYSHDGRQETLDAFGAVVRSMQRSCWPLAYHCIAHVLDWHDRANLWSRAGLPPISVIRCAFEPR